VTNDLYLLVEQSCGTVVKAMDLLTKGPWFTSCSVRKWLTHMCHCLQTL